MVCKFAADAPRSGKRKKLNTDKQTQKRTETQVQTLGQHSLFLIKRVGNVRVSLSHIGLRVWLKYTSVVFVSGGWVGEQKLQRVVDKPAHPPLARQRCKRIIKCADVKTKWIRFAKRKCAANWFHKQVAKNKVKNSQTNLGSGSVIRRGCCGNPDQHRPSETARRQRVESSVRARRQRDAKTGRTRSDVACAKPCIHGK